MSSIAKTAAGWLPRSASSAASASGSPAPPFLLADKLDPLFPLAAGIALWAMAAGFGLLRHARAGRLPSATA
jgi:hypothetical protein